jgi:hypothetical protein
VELYFKHLINTHAPLIASVVDISLISALTDFKPFFKIYYKQIILLLLLYLLKYLLKVANLLDINPSRQQNGVIVTLVERSHLLDYFAERLKRASIRFDVAETCHEQIFKEVEFVCLVRIHQVVNVKYHAFPVKIALSTVYERKYRNQAVQ